MKILAIDDKPSQLAAISEMLRSLLPECEVLEASSGRQGLALARTFQPDTIILDIVMPGLDGFQVCKVLKEEAATRHIPVIFLTGQVDNATARIRGLEIGGDAFMTHPL
jgi:DNA-binding response OmpR family regulator